MQPHSIRYYMVMVLGFIFSVLLQAQVFEKSSKEDLMPPNSYLIHASDLLRKQEIEIGKYVVQHPEVLKPNALKKASSLGFIVGSTHSWYADNFINSTRYLVPSTCKAVGNNCYIFVEDSSWNTKVTQTAVDSIRVYFDSKTPADPSKGIFATDTSTFGIPPDVDGDPKVVILLLDIKDGYSGGGFVGGYFYSYNEMPVSPQYPTSNHAEIFFIDTNPLNLQTAWGLSTAISTLAHEFQHMIHFNHDPGEIAFVNEGCSTLAEVVCGFSIYNPSLYANEPNHYLFDWRSDLTIAQNDYSRAARFMVYIRDQAGIGVFKNIVASTLHGTSGIDAGLTVSGSSLRFNEILHNWFIANILNDRSVDPSYGYIYPNLPKCVGRTFYDPNISLRTDTVQNYAVQYLSFKSGSQLRATINCSNPALVVKAVEIGTSSKRVLDVTSGVEFYEPDFGTTYSEVDFVIMNTNVSTPYTYTYQASGSSSSIEPKYDFGEPGGYYPTSANDTVCVWFNAVSGGRLDSIRVAIRRAGTMNGGIWTYTGATRPTPLGTKLASISATVTATPGVPYPIPWNNWGTADVHSQNISTNSPFAVAFINQGDGSTTPRIMFVPSPFPSSITSLIYLNGSGSPNWYYLNSNTAGDSVVTWMIRAYVSIPVGVSRTIELTPANYSLEQNYPNPFNPSTIIQYNIPYGSFVTLKVYDMIGREVSTLLNDYRQAGRYQTIFDASNLPSGIYFYRIVAGKFTETKKLVFIK